MRAGQQRRLVRPSHQHPASLVHVSRLRFQVHMEQLLSNLSRAVEDAPWSTVHFYVMLAGARWRQRLVNKRRWRVDERTPSLPSRADSGSTARNPNRTSDAAFRPVVGNSGSSVVMISSKSGTCWWSWVLIPQTRKSPKGGRRRSKATGQSVIYPSTCGIGASAMSLSFMGAGRQQCTPVRLARTLVPGAERPAAPILGVRHRPAEPLPSTAYSAAAGKARRAESSRRQNVRSKLWCAYVVNLASRETGRNLELRQN